MHWTTYFRA